MDEGCIVRNGVLLTKMYFLRTLMVLICISLINATEKDGGKEESTEKNKLAEFIADIIDGKFVKVDDKLTAMELMEIYFLFKNIAKEHERLKSLLKMADKDKAIFEKIVKKMDDLETKLTNLTKQNKRLKRQLKEQQHAEQDYSRRHSGDRKHDGHRRHGRRNEVDHHKDEHHKDEHHEDKHHKTGDHKKEHSFWDRWK